MEQVSNSLIHNGFIKLHSTTIEGKSYEYTTGKNSVCTLLAEFSDNPLEDIITLGLQFRPGAFLSDIPEEQSYTSAAGYIDDGETPVEAAHRESEEEFGAKGVLNKLGIHYVSPGNSTLMTHLFFMEVREWVEPTDKTEGIYPLKFSLAELLRRVNNPYVVTSLHIAALVNKYATYRGV